MLYVCMVVVCYPWGNKVIHTDEYFFMYNSKFALSAVLAVSFVVFCYFRLFFALTLLCLVLLAFCGSGSGGC